MFNFFHNVISAIGTAIISVGLLFTSSSSVANKTVSVPVVSTSTSQIETVSTTTTTIQNPISTDSINPKPTQPQENPSPQTTSVQASSPTKPTISTSSQPTPIIKYFIAGPQTIEAGQESLIGWYVINATSCTINSASVPLIGSRSTEILTNSSNYTLECSNSNSQSISKTLTVNVVTTPQVSTPNNVTNSILPEDNPAVDAEQAKENSPECLAATTAYNQINQQYTSAETAQNSQFNSIINSSLPLAEQGAQISALEAQQSSYSLTSLALKQESALNAKYAACDTWQPTSAPIINTNCNVTGSFVSCSSI